MQYFLETDRLILRDLLETDLEGIFELDSNQLVNKYLGNNPVKTKKQSADIIKFIHKQYKNLGIGRLAVIEKTSGDFIGWSGLKLNTGEKEALNGKTEFYDVGYRFIPRYWGNGYATESALATLDFGFKSLNLETICGAAEIEDIASHKVLQKIGLKFINEFTYDSTQCNWYELKKIDYAKTMS